MNKSGLEKLCHHSADGANIYIDLYGPQCVKMNTLGYLLLASSCGIFDKEIEPILFPKQSSQGAWMGVNRIANWGPYLLLNNKLELYFVTISE